MLTQQHTYAAQLKVNLRPIWLPTTAAIVSLGQNFGDLIWRLVFEELKAAAVVCTEGEANSLPTWAKDSLAADEDNDIREEERSWRDPSAHKLRCVVTKWTRGSLLDELRKVLSCRLLSCIHNLQCGIHSHCPNRKGLTHNRTRRSSLLRLVSVLRLWRDTTATLSRSSYPLRAMGAQIRVPITKPLSSLFQSFSTDLN